MGKYVRVRRAAQMLCVSTDTIYRYVREGLIDSVKPKGVILVDLESIRKLVMNGKPP